MKVGLRKIGKYIHGRLALAIGLVFALISWTGALLVYEQEVLRWIHPQHYRIENPGVTPLKVDQLMEKVKKQLPAGCYPGSLTLFADRHSTWQVEIANKRSAVVFVDPYTGHIVGMHDEDSGFFYWVRRLHRWLLFDYKRGSDTFCLGKFLIGSVTLLSVFVLLSGLAIWIPRSWQMLWRRLRVKTDAGWHRLCYDWHVAGGFYLCLFLLMLALTGLTWSFAWYRKVFYAPFGVDYQSTRNYNAHLEFVPRTVDYEAWQTAWQDVRTVRPQYRKVTIEETCIKVSDRLYGNQRRNDSWTFDEHTGRLTEYTSYAELPRQDRIRGWIFALHEGVWGGHFSKLLTFVAGLGGGFLPLTGYWLFHRRKRKKKS